MKRAVILSYRLGGTDGVAVEARKWGAALSLLGFEVATVAGSGTADVVLPELSIEAAPHVTGNPDPDEVDRLARRITQAIGTADLVLAENICSLPLNPIAYRSVARALAGRRAVLHHHDLATQRPALAHFGAPPDDPAWIHVTINRLSQSALASVGIDAALLYNHFDPDPPQGRRAELRGMLDVADGDLLLLQPTRAIARKNVPAAVALAGAVARRREEHRIHLWILGPAEEGYGDELARALEASPVPVLHGVAEGFSVDDCYAASDAVLFPSQWEGFGNPTIESATHDRPLAVGGYPVARELRGFGFRWFDCEDAAPLADFLLGPDRSLLEHNHDVARRHFSLDELPGRIEKLLAGRTG